MNATAARVGAFIPTLVLVAIPWIVRGPSLATALLSFALVFVGGTIGEYLFRWLVGFGEADSAPLSPVEREEIASGIEGFLDGNCGPYDWDDLLSQSPVKKDHRAVLNFLVATQELYPTDTGWCSDVGAERLAAFAELLRSGADSATIDAFIDCEINRGQRGEREI